MECPRCQHPYQTASAFLPTLLPTGETLCFKCNKELHGESSIILNHSLINLLQKNQCKTHKINYTVFCVEDNQKYCEKCIIFDKKCQSIKNKELISLNDLPLLMKKSTAQLHKIKTNIQTIIRRIEDDRKQAIHELKLKVDAQAHQLIQKVQKSQQKMKATIDAQFNGKNDQWNKLTKNFLKLRKESPKSTDLTKLAKCQQISQDMKIVQKQMAVISENVLNQLKTLQHKFQYQKYSFKWEGEFVEDQLDISFQAEKIEENLLEEEQIQTNVSMIEWIKAEELTETTSNFSLVFEEKKEDSKVLQIRDKNKLPKVIPSHIRTVRANNLQLSSQEAKQLMRAVINSFVKELDLRCNKISSNFVSEIKTKNTSKYLKKLNLAENCIVAEDTINRKVQFLKKHNLNVVL